ncbi:Ent-kaurene oxidase, partial [Leucoagaricus sp. SymC.cos]
LDQIPTVGPSGNWIYHIAGAVKTFFYGYRMIQEGYEMYRIFKIPRYCSWLVLLNGPEYLEDIRKAGAQLSFPEALNKAGQFDYTISPGLREDVIHLNVVRGSMTRNIASRFPDLVDETDKALESLLDGATQDWVVIPCYLSVVHIISRISARFFAGPKLSSNKTYTGIMQSYAFHLIKGGFFISLFPSFLKAFVGRAIFDSQGRIRKVENFLRPILNERLEKGIDENCDAESNDMITWLWNGSPEAQQNLHDIAIRMIYLNVAAIHTTANLLTHVLLSLAAYTSYIEPLREEISSAVEREGWTKSAIEQMRKLDSFVKESQRLYGGDAAMIVRLAMTDFRFSDGTFIPKGTSLAVTGRAINQDEASFIYHGRPILLMYSLVLKRYYPNPQEFQGFRFVDKDPLKWQMTSLNSQFVTYGIGRHACPGRFFAVTEVKTVVARLLMEYDIRLTDNEGVRPADQWCTGIFVAPNKKATISLRRRSRLP